jgi:hypothetical protein
VVRGVVVGRREANQMKFWEEQDLPAFWQPRITTSMSLGGLDRTNHVLSLDTFDL